MRNKKYYVMGLIFIIIIALFTNYSYASGTQDMKKLTYDARLNEDGSMDVTETWNIRVSDTNTLFKTFKKDSKKYKGITNVKVEEINNNESIEFEQIYQEMYHVTKGCFYALDINSSEFEIAWGVSIGSAKNKTYKISYTVEDVVHVYQDCSELYWQFLGTNNGMDVDNITGTIKLPEAVGDIDNLRVWAHGDLSGEINKISKDTVEFNVKNLPSKTMLEVRVVTLENVFPQSTNKISTNKLESILEEETKWADEANAKRTRARVLMIAINVGIALIGVFMLTKTKKYIGILKENKKIVPQTKVDYYRDIPDENAVPADAAFLYYFGTNGIRANISKIFSATLLDLCLKKYLEFEVNNTKKVEEVKVKLLNNEKNVKLTKTEEIVLEQLNKVDNNEFTIKELQKYMRNHSERFVRDLEKISNEAKEEQIKKENYDIDIAKKGSIYSGIAVLYVVLMMGTLIFGLVWGYAAIFTAIVSLINAILSANVASRFNGLTQKGADEKELWHGLKRYMQDFSLIKEREVPELVLWEKYLVYATVFGIADRVIKQLKIVYPQLSNDDLIGDYAYMHMMTRSDFGLGFITSMNSAIAHSYQSAYTSTYSSGSGRRRWILWRRRWPEEAAAGMGGR